MSGGAVPTREELRAQLVEARIAGAVATPREDNLRKYWLFASRKSYAMFGLSPEGAWTTHDVLALMAERVGVSPDAAHREGQDHIDPDLAVVALDRMATELAAVARSGARVMLATGHPSGLLAVHVPIARALSDAGAEIIRPAAGTAYDVRTDAGMVTRYLAYVAGVCVLGERGDLVHTHSARPMELALAALGEAGEPMPDLVVADHGWCGAAGQAGVRAVGFADSNDPGLFVGEAEGTVAVAVPLDDNVDPHLYDPMTAYLLSTAGLG